MANNLIEMARRSLTPQLVEQTAGTINQPIDRTKSALNGGISAMFAGLLQRVQRPGGSDEVFDAIKQPNQEGVLGRLFGNKLGPLGDMVASHAGIPSTAGPSILGVVWSVIAGLLGREVATRGLTAGGLGSLIMGQKNAIMDDPHMPRGLLAAFGLGAPAAMAATKKRRLGPLVAGLVALGLLALLGLALFRRHPAGETTITGAKMNAPAISTTQNQPPVVKTTPGRVEARDPLAAALTNDSLALPAKVELPKIRFDFGAKTPTADSTTTIDAVAADLKAHPAARIRVEGNTDALGDVDYNRYLSMQRSDAVKAMLVDRGIDAGRIETGASGEERPVAGNESDQGRAENRRVEVTLLSR